jgi:hypothetical protein
MMNFSSPRPKVPGRSIILVADDGVRNQAASVDGNVTEHQHLEPVSTDDERFPAAGGSISAWQAELIDKFGQSSGTDMTSVLNAAENLLKTARNVSPSFSSYQLEKHFEITAGSFDEVVAATLSTGKSIRCTCNQCFGTGTAYLCPDKMALLRELRQDTEYFRQDRDGLENFWHDYYSASKFGHITYQCRNSGACEHKIFLTIEEWKPFDLTAWLVFIWDGRVPASCYKTASHSLSFV